RVLLSHDRKVVAASGSDSIVYLWDRDTGKELRRFSGEKNRVSDFALAPDGKTLASGAFVLQVWDLATGKEVQQIRNEAGVIIKSLTYSPDGKTVAAVWRDKTIRRYDIATGKEIAQIQADP